MNLLEIEKEFAKILSDLRKRGYVDTAEQLGILVDYWRKSRRKIYSDPRTRNGIRRSFNTIKGGTTRNEFLERYAFAYSAEIFDAVDNMFSRLTNTPEASSKYFGLVAEVMQETSVFRNLAETERKVNVLARIAKGMPRRERFYILCFSFLIEIEGYYDELLRLIYVTELHIAGATIPQPHKLEFTRVEEMKSKVKSQPKAIFEIWDLDHNIRNAIAHSRFYYTETDQKMRFVDVDPRTGETKIDEYLSFEQLETMWRRIGVVGKAFELLLSLLFLYPLLTIPADEIHMLIPKSKEPSNLS